ncbi:MAG: GNAT family N-acetyltransferase [Deltaproteobacteria bacterium]|nr:MAG: GNAT family N-acetyltransferase [Deltaproteobacteria bacterium]
MGLYEDMDLTRGSAADNKKTVSGPDLRWRNDSTTAPAILIEAMRPNDLAEVLIIQQDGLSSLWSEASFAAEIEEPDASLYVARLMGVEKKCQVLGYICFWVVADEIQMANLAVHIHYRRRGVGRQLVLYALRTGYRAGARLAVLEVSLANAAAKALYEKLSFVPIHGRPFYYPESREAALVLKLSLGRAWRHQQCG